MDMFEKIVELQAKSVTSEEFEEVWGESREEAMKKVKDFVRRFAEAKEKRTRKKGKKGKKVVSMRRAAEPLAPAAVVLDPAAAPAAASVGPVDHLTVKVAKKMNSVKVGKRTGVVVTVMADKGARNRKAGLVAKSGKGMKRPKGGGGRML